MSKPTNQYLSIGEVAKAINVTRRIILNYEDKGLIQADVKEGTHGNRYYSADTTSRIRTIRILQNLGLSLDEIYAYYNDATELEPLIARLELLRDELNLNIEKLKERVNSADNYTIQTTTIPAQTIYREVRRATTVEEKKDNLREAFLIALSQYGSDTSKRMFFIEYSLDDPDLISYCVAVTPNSQGENIFTLEEEKALSVFYHGDYEALPAVRDELIAYAKENNMETKGICRHVYLEGPPQHRDPSKFITQVLVLLK